MRPIDEQAGAATASYALIAAVIAIAAMPLVIQFGGEIIALIRRLAGGA